jgi:branched-chain amino acid transport system substrate-binding protein
MGLLVLAAGGLLATVLPAASAGAASSGSIVVGFDVDTSGPGASYNVPAMAVSKAEIAIINKDGGINGKKITTVECDDASDPTKVGACLEQLKNDGASFILQETGSPAVAQGKTTVQQLEIPTISATNATPVTVAAPNNTYIYTIGESTTVWGPAYCNGFKRAGIKTIALFEDNTPTIAGFTPPLLASMPCVKVVNTQVAPSTATDLTAEIARLASPKADAIFMSSAVSSFEVLAHNEMAQQYPKELVADVATLCGTPPDWKLANPGALVGSVCMGSIDSTNPNTIKVQKILQKSQGKSFQLTQFTGEAWDAVHVMQLALTKAKSLNGNVVNKALESIKNVPSSFGYPGFTIGFTATKHNGSNGPCGVLLVQYGPTNTTQHVWSKFHPTC